MLAEPAVQRMETRWALMWRTHSQESVCFRHVTWILWDLVFSSLDNWSDKYMCCKVIRSETDNIKQAQHTSASLKVSSKWWSLPFTLREIDMPKIAKTSYISECPQENTVSSQGRKGFIFLIWFPHTRLTSKQGWDSGFLSFGIYAEESIVMAGAVGQKNCVIWELYPSFYYCGFSSL